MTRARGESDSALLCSAPGCCNRWTSNFGARYCREHDPGINGHTPVQRQSTLHHMPTLRDAMRPFSEPTDRDEEYFHGE
jgi:hypothetical protein